MCTYSSWGLDFKKKDRWRGIRRAFKVEVFDSRVINGVMGSLYTAGQS